MEDRTREKERESEGEREKIARKELPDRHLSGAVVCDGCLFKIEALLDVVLRTMEQLDIDFQHQLQRKNNHSKHPCSELLVRNAGSRE